eukprot:761684-Hanusia_phi.AAC.9
MKRGDLAGLLLVGRFLRDSGQASTSIVYADVHSDVDSRAFKNACNLNLFCPVDTTAGREQTQCRARSFGLPGSFLISVVILSKTPCFPAMEDTANTIAKKVGEAMREAKETEAARDDVQFAYIFFRQKIVAQRAAMRIKILSHGLSDMAICLLGWTETLEQLQSILTNGLARLPICPSLDMLDSGNGHGMVDCIFPYVLRDTLVALKYLGKFAELC